jgi:hypothetical protein
LPSADPTLGDKRSCDALELVVVPRVCHEGGITPSHHNTSYSPGNFLARRLEI